MWGLWNDSKDVRIFYMKWCFYRCNRRESMTKSNKHYNNI